MKLDRNIKEHPTAIHRDIFLSAMHMTPPELSLAPFYETDPALARSGEQFYGFMSELFAQMYQAPETFGFHPGEYENFLNGRKFNAVKRKSGQPREAQLFHDKLGSEVSTYLSFLKELAFRCVPTVGGCKLSTEDFAAVKDYGYMPKVRRKYAIPAEKVLESLERSGMSFSEDENGEITVKCSEYPDMFYAASALAKAASNVTVTCTSKCSKNGYAKNFDYLEFRQILGNYDPDYDDITCYLSDGDRELVNAVCEMAREYKLRPQYSRFSIIYKYKGKPVFSFNTDGRYTAPFRERKTWSHDIGFRIFISSHPEYQQHIADLGEDCVRYLMRRLNYCGCCNEEHAKRPPRRVLGRNVKLCSSEIRCEVNHASMQDLPYMRKFIELRIRAINEGKQ